MTVGRERSKDEAQRPHGLHAAYAPKELARVGQHLVERLTKELQSSWDGETRPVMTPVTPDQMMAQTPRPTAGTQSLDELFDRFLSSATRLHDPHFVGHQVSAPLPAAVWFQALGAYLNNGMAVFEMGPAATAMERRVLEWMAGHAGFTAKAEGFFTSGGSIGNLTALLTARQVMAGLNERGQAKVAAPAILVSGQGHYCSARAVHIMGWGADGLIEVECDAKFKMRPSDLSRAKAEAERRGRQVIAVAASACSTSTGSYDPLEAIADFCEEHHIWLHVDGAHGASALLSPRLKPRLAGLERADSLVWDAHKMLMMPALSTAVIYRNGEHASRALAQKASYLFDGDPDLEWFNVGHRTLECTKTMMASALYASLAHYGENLFKEFVEHAHDLATEFASYLESSPDFIVACRPESNIVCFRHEPENASDLDARQLSLRRKIVDSGEFYLVQTSLGGKPWLRCTLMNPRTKIADLIELCDQLRRS
ncbi:MAG: aminotransferase class I/II-fold pyridoxal phosphate-dependent enzyme [Planctomycetota bacterium]